MIHRHGLRILRVSLGGVYIWFGLLKVINLSPAASLVLDVLPFQVGSWFVPALGWAEIVMGAWLVTGRSPRLLLPVLCGHLGGTFSVLLLTPAIAYQNGNPVLLTLTGEFVVKNVVLLAAAIVVTTMARAATTPRLPEVTEPAPTAGRQMVKQGS
ncbi:hypothetical protein [Streptomyces sp. NPDC002779]|uniref:hypothetical protein n=1 Tax=Streptomyces sp. NPDC002779 TaxID=3364664 RepID=UPI0036B7033D